MKAENEYFESIINHKDLASVLQLKKISLTLPSYKVENVAAKPLFFYHIPKTAGTTVRNTLMLGMKTMNKINVSLGNKTFNGIIDNMYGWDTSYAKEQLEQIHNFVCAWKPCGFHTNFNQDFNIFTIIREPFSRIVSRFRYKCQFNQYKCTDDDFRLFYRNEKQYNHQTKMLSGNGDNFKISNIELEIAKENLQSFFAYTTINHVNQLLTELLSLYQLPSYIGEKSNVTLAEFELNWSKHKDEIMALNEFDLALFEFVDKSPKHPSLSICDDNSISKYASILKERDKDDNFKVVTTEVAKIAQALGIKTP